MIRFSFSESVEPKMLSGATMESVEFPFPAWLIAAHPFTYENGEAVINSETRFVVTAPRDYPAKRLRLLAFSALEKAIEFKTLRKPLTEHPILCVNDIGKLTSVLINEQINQGWILDVLLDSNARQSRVGILFPRETFVNP
jgi:hypothetical protein